MPNVFVIVDREDGRPYVKRGWRLRVQAEAELAGLLRFFPEDHEWRRRLYVAEASPSIFSDVEGRTSRPITKRDALRSIQNAVAPGAAQQEAHPEDQEASPITLPSENKS